MNVSQMQFHKHSVLLAAVVLSEIGQNLFLHF